MKRKIKKMAIWLGVLLVLAITGGIIFSPYGSHEGLPYKAVAETVEINTSVENVYKFLGKSSNAARWSVYVDHITPLNSDVHPDGTVGCKRRCFTSKNETGPTWDETILINEPAKKRRLNCYNLQNFIMTANHLQTDQLYIPTGKNSCTLTLTVFFDGEESFWDRFKMYFAAYKIASIFRGNLENIKRLSESDARDGKL